MALGRPTSYKPEYCDMIIKHMRTGKSLASFAMSIDVNRDSLQEWGKVHPNFSVAMKKAKDYCEVFWEEQGNAHILEDKDGPKLNMAWQIFTMKARFGWREKQEVEVNNTVNTPQVIVQLPPKEE
jgi:hypothetical protein